MNLHNGNSFQGFVLQDFGDEKALLESNSLQSSCQAYALSESRFFRYWNCRGEIGGIPIWRSHAGPWLSNAVSVSWNVRFQAEDHHGSPDLALSCPSGSIPRN
jgi:hypothetical protein